MDIKDVTLDIDGAFQLSDTVYATTEAARDSVIERMKQIGYRVHSHGRRMSGLELDQAQQSLQPMWSARLRTENKVLCKYCQHPVGRREALTYRFKCPNCGNATSEHLYPGSIVRFSFNNDDAPSSHELKATVVRWDEDHNDLVLKLQHTNATPQHVTSRILRENRDFWLITMTPGNIVVHYQHDGQQRLHGYRNDIVVYEYGVLQHVRFVHDWQGQHFEHEDELPWHYHMMIVETWHHTIQPVPQLARSIFRAVRLRVPDTEYDYAPTEWIYQDLENMQLYIKYCTPFDSEAFMIHCEEAEILDLTPYRAKMAVIDFCYKQSAMLRSQD